MSNRPHLRILAPLRLLALPALHFARCRTDCELWRNTLAF